MADGPTIQRSSQRALEGGRIWVMTESDQNVQACPMFPWFGSVILIRYAVRDRRFYSVARVSGVTVLLTDWLAMKHRIFRTDLECRIDLISL